MSKITADELRTALAYDANLGTFTWIIRPSKAVKIGYIAGTLDDKGYVLIGVNKHVYKAHRLAWLYVTGEWPNGLIDHIDGNKSNNSFTNLRVVNESGNSQNVRRPNKRNKSGFMGVIFFQNKWRANITHAGKTHWLGDFSTPEEAHKKYIEAKRKFHIACTI
jgi:hypothetical protein